MSEKQDRSARIHPRTSQDRQDAGAAPKQLSQGIYSFEKERANFPGRDSGGRCRDHGLQVDIAGYETWPPQRLRGPRSHAGATLLLWDTHDLSRIAGVRRTRPQGPSTQSLAMPFKATRSGKTKGDGGAAPGRWEMRPRTAVNGPGWDPGPEDVGGEAGEARARSGGSSGMRYRYRANWGFDPRPRGCHPWGGGTRDTGARCFLRLCFCTFL